MRPRAAPRARRPYRDTLIAYALLAGLVVVVAAITGGDLLRAILIAAGCFVAATAWSWWRIHAREAQEEQL
jgi:Flp pilus assembly protein TadB